MDGEKTCSACHVAKPLSEFNKRKASNDGLAQKCKACCASYSAAYRKSAKGKATIAAYFKSDKGKAAVAAYYKTEKGKATKARSDQRYSSSEKGKATRSAYMQTDGYKAARARYRASEHGKTAITNYRQSEQGRHNQHKHRANNAYQHYVYGVLNNYVRRNKDNPVVREVTGMNTEDIRMHLERDGRSIDDSDIDHIIPGAAFKQWGDMECEFYRRAYGSYRNMQLLSKSKNSSKGGRCEKADFDAYIIEFTLHDIIDEIASCEDGGASTSHDARE